MIATFLIWYSLTFGMHNQDINMLNPAYQMPSYYAIAEIHIENSLIDIYTVYQNKIRFGGFCFDPATDFYAVGVLLKYKQISLNIEHKHLFPVQTELFEPDRLLGDHTKIAISIRCTRGIK